MNVYLTFDVEVWCGSWDDLDARFPKAFERYVYGRSRHGDYALPKTLEILSRHDLGGIFFVEPLFSARFGADHLREIVSLIRGHGQDVQLHLHPEWSDEVTPPLLNGLDAKKALLCALTPDQQKQLIATGLRLLHEAGAPSVDAFRAGSYAANPDTLGALQASGIAVDSSYNECFRPIDDASPTGFAPPLASTEAVAEYPVSAFVDGFGRIRHAQVGACSFAEMSAALESALVQGVDDFVIVSHNFEMLRPGRTDPDWIVVRRFERLCEYLASNSGRFRVARRFPSQARSARIATRTERPRATAGATLIRLGEQAWRRAAR